MARNRTTVAYNPFYLSPKKYGVVKTETPRSRKRFPTPRVATGRGSASSMSMSESVRRQIGGSAGTIARFRKTKKGGFKRESMTSYRGFQQTIEANYLLDDPDCVYVGHSTGNAYSHLVVAMGSVLRTLFKKIGVNFKSPTESMNILYDNGGSAQEKYLVVHLHESGSDAGFVKYYAPLQASDTFKDVVLKLVQFAYPINGVQVPSALSRWTTLPGQPAVTLTGLSGFILTSLDMIEPVVGDSSPSEVKTVIERAKLDLMQCRINLWVNSSLKVQNQSEKSDATGDDADTINAIPLIGKQYFGKTADPIFKGWFRGELTALSTTKCDPLAGSIQWKPGSFLSNTQNFKEPPPPTAFYKVGGASGVKISPGEIKYSTINYKKSMLLNYFIRGIGIVGDQTLQLSSDFWKVDIWDNKKRGNFKLFALEKPINFATADKVKIAYEVQTNIGCSATFGRKYYMNREFIAVGP